MFLPPSRGSKIIFLLVSYGRTVEILGVHFDSKMRQESHVSSRVHKCRRAFKALKDVGLGYPGCNAKVKAYL